MRYLLFIICLHFGSYISWGQDIEAGRGLIPLPASVTWLQDSVHWSDVYFDESASWHEAQPLIHRYFPQRGKQTAHKTKLLISKDIGLAAEAYRLTFTASSIELKVSDYRGVVNGIQTMRQLTREEGSQSYLYKANIEDAPAFRYRGMHLDVGRHFFPKAFILSYLDMMARYKMNVFHWHLTEDQGWRVEIKKYPRLQTVAAWRDKTLVGHASTRPKIYDNKQYGGYYTQEDIREIVAYAAGLGIEVIPEIELPGHASAAIAAYPELGCTGKPIEVVGDWGVFEDVFCPNEVTFQFLEDVLSEIIPLFPSPYIHIGGDECPKAQWKNSPLCQELIQKLDLGDEHGLQSYFIKRVEKLVNSRGKKIIGWDEILEGGLAPNATVMSWRGIEGGLAAASMGHDVIMTPTDYCYLDYYQSESPREPLAIGGYLPLERVYSYHPIPSDLANDKVHHIMGTQGNVWTEYLESPDKVWYQILPRMLAIAETGWTSPAKKHLQSFLDRLEPHYVQWKRLGIRAADKRYELYHEIKEAHGQGIHLKVRSKGNRFKTHILQDGKAISNNDGLIIDKSCHIKAIVEGSPAPDSMEFNFQWHKAAGKKVGLEIAPDDRYTAFGPVTLTDALDGPEDSFKHGWLGFNKENLSIEIQINPTEEIDTVTIGFYHQEGQWIHLPDAATLTLTGDTDLKPIHHEWVQKGGQRACLTVVLQPFKTQKLRIAIPNNKKIASGMPGEGHIPWVFIDEIRVR